MAKELCMGALGVGVVVLGLFILMSVSSLSYNQIGLNYSSYFKSVENKTYDAGFHFIGLGHTFIPYQLSI